MASALFESRKCPILGMGTVGKRGDDATLQPSSQGETMSVRYGRKLASFGILAPDRPDQREAASICSRLPEARESAVRDLTSDIPYNAGMGLKSKPTRRDLLQAGST